MKRRETYLEIYFELGITSYIRFRKDHARQLKPRNNLRESIEFTFKYPFRELFVYVEGVDEDELDGGRRALPE